MSKEQKLCKLALQSEDISTPIYVECDKMYRSKVCIQEFWYFVSGLDIQLEKSEYESLYDSPVWQVAKNLAGGEMRRVIYRFFRATDTNQWLSG